LTAERSRAKKIVGGIYSFAADKIYEPLVVKGAFRIFGGPLNTLVVEQGRKAVKIADGRPILDMPVGTAYFTIEMAKIHPGVVVGVDIAHGMVVEARAAARREMVSGLEVVEADSHHLPFEDGAFGAILCTNGLQVIPGLQPTLKELARVLAPDGTLFVSVVNLPVANSTKVPTFLLSRAALADELRVVGLKVDSVQAVRLATLIEARKPAGAGVGAFV
jgi:ubiquinone/menaquinone biosynthesis C-methylase UbiE